jgi:hypothetical protein
MKKVLFLFLLLFLAFPIFACLPVGKVMAEQIDINTANLSQLDEIVHVGQKTAQKIIDGRPYSSVSDLSRVKGIGSGKYLQDIINQGWACVNCQTAATQTTQTAQTADTNQATDTTNQTTTPSTKPAIIYPSGVVINEILPNPQGPDETNEWIELYNSNNSDVDLSDWQIQDTEGTVTTYTINKNIKILANGFLVLKRSDTKIMLNNDKDGLNLLTPDKNIVDSMTFASAPLNQSYDKTKSGWQWSTTLTPGAGNVVTAFKTGSNTKTLSKTNNSVKNNDAGLGLANISQSINTNQDSNLPAQAGKTTNPWFLFFTTLVITIILATAVLFIKLKLFKNHVRT